MKRLFAVLLVVSMLTLGACGSARKTTPPTCQVLIAAYEEAGYHVFHCETGDYDWDCYVQIWKDDEYDAVYFHFFSTEEEAKAYDDEREYNILIYLFSVIYGDPQWLYTETCGNIEYEYTNEDLLEPFEKLIR